MTALHRLRSVIEQLKRGDPLTPVTVLVPTDLAGIVVRRFLAGGIAGRTGVAGLDVTTLARLAERIALPFLAPRRPATRPVLSAAWRRVLAERPGVFDPIKDHPATVRALVRAHAEMRELTPAGLEAVRRSSAPAAELVDRFERVVAALAPDWFDRADLLEVAATRVGRHPGAAVLYLPQDLSRREAEFARALAAGAELQVVAALTGDERADHGIRRALAAVGAPAPDPPPPPTAQRVITASDSDDEVRCVVRELTATLQATPAHRVAVLYADAVPYARLLHEQLARLRVNGPGVRPVEERAVARVLREILALADRDVPRADLFRALATAPARDFTGTRIPVAAWERLSRAAGVVAGDDWERRIASFVRDRRGRMADEAADEDDRQWVIDRFGRDIEAAGALQDFATRLRAELASGGTLHTWRELADWCERLFVTLVGHPEELSRALPEEERGAAATVLTVLRAIGSLDTVEPVADLGRLRDVLDVELAAALPRVGRFGDGVFVGPLSAAVGLDLDAVFVVGLSEDLCPGRIHPDALLPDRVRALTDGQLASQGDRLAARHRHLLAAFGCAASVVASFPRGDLRRSTRRLPSRWLLPTLRQLSGGPALAATEWDRADYGGALHSAGSFAGELLATAGPGSEQEWRTRQAVAGRLVDDAVTAAVEMVRAPAGATLTRFDGNLAAAADLPRYAIEDRPISPTSLEQYTSCPHAYFVHRLLRVRPVENPEEILVIPPVEIGNLVHQSVEQLVTEFAGDLPADGKPWTDEQHRRLAQIAREKADAFEARGITGHPRLWQAARVRILSDVRAMLHSDDEQRRKRGATVIASEMPFGMRGRPPVRIAVDGGRVLMRGSADLVQLDGEGRLWVIDIKTGRKDKYAPLSQDNPDADGTRLQLPVYAFAARQRFGAPDTPVAAEYWFVGKDKNRIGVRLTDTVERRFREVVAVIVDSIAAGLFPAVPPSSPDYNFVSCPYCNPDGIGYGDGHERWERKRRDPALRGLVALIEPGPDASADDRPGPGRSGMR